MTFKCPFRDQLQALDKVEGVDEEGGAAGGAPSGSGSGGLGSGTGKYQPP